MIFSVKLKAANNILACKFCIIDPRHNVSSSLYESWMLGRIVSNDAEQLRHHLVHVPRTQAICKPYNKF